MIAQFKTSPCFLISLQVLLVLERCDLNLRQWLQQQRLGSSFSSSSSSQPARAWVSAALAKFSEVAGLVAQLHARHVAHCDLKLDNVLLLGGACKLSDFGEASMFGRPEQGLLFESRWVARAGPAVREQVGRHSSICRT